MTVGHLISLPSVVALRLIQQIEEAHLADLDWALANMGGGASKKDTSEIYAAEKKTSGQEGVSSITKGTRSTQSNLLLPQDDFSGLGAFLLDEGKLETHLTQGTGLKRHESRRRSAGPPDRNLRDLEEYRD